MPQSPFFFPDNTVLINMALLEYVDHLQAFVQGRGRWCSTIEWEWRRSCDSHRADLFGAVFMTDDGGARELACREAAVSRCLGTVDLLDYFEVMSRIDRNEAYEALTTLKAHGCHVRPSDPAGYDQVAEGLWDKLRYRRMRRRG